MDPKLWYIYILEYYAAERKRELLPFVTTWMELENIVLSEINQGVKDKYDLTYNWNLMNKTNDKNRTRGLEIKNKLTVTRAERGGR